MHKSRRAEKRFSAQNKRTRILKSAPNAARKKVCNFPEKISKNPLHFSENYAIILSVLSASPPDTKRISAWGISTVGSARHSHCRGQEFESPMLHGWSRLKSLDLFFCFQTSRSKKPTGRRIFPLPGRVLFANIVGD